MKDEWGADVTQGERQSGPSPSAWVLVAMAVCLLIVTAIWCQHNCSNVRTICGSPHCSNCLKQIGSGVAMYRNDYDGFFPLPGDWRAALDPYIKNKGIYDCPLVKEQGRHGGYAYNAQLLGVSEMAIVSPDAIPLAFDSFPDRGLVADGPRHVVMRHGQGYSQGNLANIVFADSHTKAMSTVKHLQWDPKTKK